MTAHLISRVEINAEQREWEQERLATRQIVVDENGNLRLQGLNMHNFYDLVGPERYWNHQSYVDAVEIVEPSMSDKLRKAADWVLGKVRI